MRVAFWPKLYSHAPQPATVELPRVVLHYDRPDLGLGSVQQAPRQRYTPRSRVIGQLPQLVSTACLVAFKEVCYQTQLIIAISP